MTEEKGESTDDRAPMAKAMDWVARVTTAGMTFGIPVLGGYWLDQKLETGYLFTLVGFVLGMVAGGWQLMKIAISAGREADAESKK